MTRQSRDQQRTDAGRVPASGTSAAPPTRRAGSPTRPPSPQEARERILRERDAAVAALARLGVGVHEDGTGGPGESPFEEGDLAQASERLDMSFMQRERLAERINSLTRALGRVAAGSYGICEECRRAIDPARLAAAPEAVLCRDCQAQRERGYRAA